MHTCTQGNCWRVDLLPGFVHSVILTPSNFYCFLVGRECWMVNTMTFLSSHFTWSVVLMRSLPRQRRLPRNLHPRLVPSLPYHSCCYLRLIIPKINNLGGAGNASNRNFHFLRPNVLGFSISGLILFPCVREKWNGCLAPFALLFNKGKRKRTCIFSLFASKRVNVNPLFHMELLEVHC